MRLRIVKNPKYTFLLPAYKGRFLDEMLRSIQGQTYKDFKVIISDDCSPENLRNICEPYLSDPRFSYRRNEENMGSKSLVSHWNLLVNMCDTDYLIMASDDDVYDPQFLAEIDILTKRYPEVDLFRGRACKIDGEGNSYMQDDIQPAYTLHMEFAHLIYQPSFVSCVANYVYKRITLSKYDGFIDYPKAWFSDEATNIMMAKNGCCITKGVVFSFRKSDINISSQWGDRDDCQCKMKATILFYRWMNEYMNQVEENDLRKIVTYEYIEKVRGNIQNHIYHCSSKKFCKYLMQIPTTLGLCKLRMVVHYLNWRISKVCKKIEIYSLI